MSDGMLERAKTPFQGREEMKTRNWLSVPLVAASLLATGAIGPAQAQTPPIDKCQKQLETIGRAFEDQVFKALQFCKDAYRTAVVKAAGNADNLKALLEKQAPNCGKKLDSVLGTTGGGLGTTTPKTQAEKTYKKLSDLLATGKCSADHITQLGYLRPSNSPTDGYGDAWIRWFLTAMLKAAYEKQLWIVGDLPNIMAQFVDPDDTVTGDCATKSNGTAVGDGKNYCAVLLSSPCHKLNCRIDTTGTQLLLNICGLGTPTPTLSGEVIQEYCQFPPFTGCDVAIVGNPARSIDPVNILGSNVACTTNLRASGFVKGPATCRIGYGGPAANPGATPPTNANPATTFDVTSVVRGPKNVSICQDVRPSGGNESCPASPPPTFTLPGGTTNCSCSSAPPGPINVSLSGAMGPGDAVTSAALQIHTAPPPATNCSGTTSDASFVPLLFTTGQVDVVVKDPQCNATCGDSISRSIPGTSGFPGTLLNTNGPSTTESFVDSSDLGGGQTAGGFPGACPATLPSLVTAFKIVCQ
jgi:hypothetical protein